MKAEDREELQQNDLAEWMYHVPLLLKNYGAYILLAIALGILGVRLWYWHQESVARDLQQAWVTLESTGQSTCNDPPDKLRSIISETGNRSLQGFAYAKLGKFYLDYLTAGAPADGVQGVKVSAEQATKEAQDAFNKVIADYSDQTLALAEARLGLAVLAENNHQWAEARKQYEAILAKNGPLADTPFADVAQNRYDHIPGPDGKSKLDDWSKPALLVASAATAPAQTQPLDMPLIMPPGPALLPPPSTSPVGTPAQK